MLEIRQLSKSYGQRSVLKDLNLYIDRGEVYALLGANGAGKTTTINLICNLLRADRGSIRVNHQPLSQATKSWIGIAPQDNLLYKMLSCQENLRFFGQIYGLTPPQLPGQIQRCLEAVNLSDRARVPVEKLSGGMQRRMNVAVALIHQPKLLILDEPTVGLDLEARYEIWDLIQRLQQQGMTILLTTHFLDEAERLASRIGILKQGQIVAEGSMTELRRLIPAKEVVMVQTPDEERAIAQAQRQGLSHRYYGRDLAFWFPEHLELREIMARFEPIPLDSISRQPVRLEHIYLEVTQGDRVLTLEPSKPRPESAVR